MTITYADLLAQKAALEKQAAAIERQIQDAQRSQRADVLARIKALMSQHGLTAEDLGGKAASGPKKGENAGKKVAAKYRNPATGETWTGRGLQPKWLKSAIASGRSLGEFAIAHN
ncbi:H-NS family nucleoid-associated regulatory protein [Aquabacterium commune]|uniref:H-NS histone family protein n=1 Tax=Aquabacterium commune TaxID=70586 RepID=UPI00105FD728|nr:H-NS histone family protein [Aquabacterium commune]